MTPPEAPWKTERIGPKPYLSVDHMGAGELIVLLHGIGGNKRNWHDNLPALAAQPLVSIVIPTAGQRRRVRRRDVVLAAHCVRTIATISTYPNTEIVCVVDGRLPADARDELTVPIDVIPRNVGVVC